MSKQEKPEVQVTESKTEAVAPVAPKLSDATIKVVCTSPGYYDNEMKKVGDVFVLKPRFKQEIRGGKGEQFVLDENDEKIVTHTAAQQFSSKWMELAEEEAPVRKAKPKVDAPREPEALSKAKHHSVI